ncbi:uncharacterized protein Bfra_002967 [Botrytis fragariae]|uniref:Uncharacterized protein n=1 Tax=Botrytis fragariae TaxID=1964551 RepID=A0A8H6AZY3_9HELO|nr:uncharacterized protein Bfra_002967 [Botrytis fragariae]KAF5876562.1 hypothetical protein Bfra_002967 [Botrytis fragariae]
MHYDAGNTRNPWCVDFVSIFHLLDLKEPECLAGFQSRVTTLSPASNDSQPMQNDSTRPDQRNKKTKPY